MPTLTMTLSERDVAALTRAATEHRQSLELLVQDVLDEFLQASADDSASEPNGVSAELAERWAKLRSEARS